MSKFPNNFCFLRVLTNILKGFSFTNFAPMVRYLVLHLLAKLLHIRLESNGQDENEEERRKMESKKKKKARVEENEARAEDTAGVAREGWKRGWEDQEEEKSLENWSTLNGIELGVRLSRLETFPVPGLKANIRLASRVEASLEVHERHLEEVEAKEKVKMEWQHAALVIDRC